MTPQESVALVQGNPIVHFAGFVTIENKQNQQELPTPNLYQHRVNEAYQLCLGAGVRPMLQGLKPRRVGSSTFFGHLCYHHTRRFKTHGMMIGDESSRTTKIWKIFNDYSESDTFPWDSTVRYNTEKARFAFNDGTEAEWEHDTANDPKAGIAGTRQALWFTEAARYAKSGVREDRKVISAAMISVSPGPKSLICAESTADGASGWFYDNWKGAVTIDEFRAGRRGNGWIKIFAGWHEFPEHRKTRDANTEHLYAPELSAREKRGQDLYSWDADQIAWRRSVIATECSDDERVFDQDFPEDDESCFLSSGRPRFNLEGMSRLEQQARHDFSRRGVLERNGRSVQFVERKEDAWFWMAEGPKAGRAYICSLDPCTGAQSAGARYPDAHATGILKAPHQGEELENARLVGCIDVPNGCRWEEGMLAERMSMMVDFYGGCMCIPETGNGLAALLKIREAGISVYHREKFDHQNPNKKLKVAGWETNSSTRDIWVGAVADAILEQTLDCTYGPAVKQMRTFVINDRGKAEAKPGEHDDWITMLGLAFCCIRFASVYRDLNPSGRRDYTGTKLARVNKAGAYS